MAKEYDNSAFSYFVISLLGLYAFPMTIYIAYRLLQTFLLKEADPAAQVRWPRPRVVARQRSGRPVTR